MTDTRSDNKTFKSHITGMLAFAVLSMCIADGAAAQQRALGWVGQMFPTGGSTNSLAAGAPFTVYVQVWKPGVTDSPGAGADIGCTLLWGTVTAFGGAWSDITETAMSYNVDIGNNDEYAASISPAEGLYEFTAFCTDATDAATLYQDAGNGMLSVLPAATPLNTRALWIDEDTIAWDTSHGPAGVSFELHHDAGGDLSVPMTAGSGVALSFDRILDGASFAKFPNANGYQSLDLDPAALALIPDILRAEIALAVYDDQGNLLESTGVQIQGVLDALYAYDGSLGVEWDGGIPTLRVWAPTAKSVTLHRFADAGSGTAAATAAMSLDAATGVWSIGGDAGWDRQYYLYEVEVFVPETGNVENNLVTDPYSVSLSMNGARSQILDLADPALAPPGWDTLAKPAFAAPEDMTIYELHVRDFSAGDETVAEADRGTFRAFGYDGASAPLSDGMAHLAALADAGLTHLHILPAFDIASVNEFALIRVDPDPALLSTYASDSDLQQSSVGQFRIIDSFNWGYDPVHYGAPEGSYSSDPDDGAVRVLEFREMVASLAGSGLRIVMDVVYNHTSSFGQNSQSVLDKIVPNYYHRYDANGFIMRSSCCNDTATEFAMMQKLMLDTLLRWASAYKVDAFRFDLMNLHTPANMAAVRAALQSLTPADEGVDGNDIFVYGEGWDFGSLRDKGFVHAAQFNMAGSGVGTFNDRIRDAVHGGFDTDSLAIRTQGFVNGQSFDWNGHLYDKRFQGDLRFSMDRIRVGLSGNLQSFEFIDQSGNPQSGLGLSGTGYALDPQEAIQYISKHDNETLYDLNVFKAPLGASGTAVTSMADRVRIQNLGLSIVGLSQGVPFFHAGSDLLRSKSLDRNSFDSGDWFNTLDFALQSNNFGVGLPPAWDNESRWPIMAPLLTDPTLLPAPADIARSAAHFQEILAIRRSAKLFRLETAEDVMTRMRVHNTGPQQTDGLIVLSLSDEIEPDVDPLHEYLVVLFNADKSAHSFTIPELAGRPFVLHPVQAASDDPLVRTANVDTSSATFDVPARTTAVFVVASAADTDGDGLVDTGDNCIEEPNPDQRDTDGDGIGNACDPDLPPNNDCAINFLDLAVLKAAMFSTPGSPNWNPDADLDGDGSVNFVDLGQMKSRFFLVPGPAAPPNLCADRD